MIEELLAQSGSAQWSDWRWQMAHCIRDAAGLARAAGLSSDAVARATRCAEHHALVVTPYYLSLAAALSPTDPILRQVLPSAEEVSVAQHALSDPLGEARHSPAPRLVHRHRDRVLLVVTNRCAVHCRHCLRRRAWGAAGSWPGRAALTEALAYIRQTPHIREVILSGGDPLLVPEPDLFWLLSSLRAIRSVEIIRIGTRLPAALPQRFTPAFCERLGEYGPVWVATQFNHPREVTSEAGLACERLVRAGLPLVNQTVLLRGVNDCSATIRRLGTELLRIRVKPYYLFHGDPVLGTMHFRTGIERGLTIMAELEGETSGLAVPTFALDLPDGAGKVRLQPATYGGTEDTGAERIRFQDGSSCSYPGFDARR